MTLERFQDDASIRRRALVMAAAMPALPLRRELERVVSPYDRGERARDAVDELLREGLLELVDFGSGVRLRLTDAGRDELVTLPGDPPRPPGGRWLPVDRSEAIVEPEGTPSSRRVGCLRLVRGEGGQTASEVALLIGAMLVACVAAAGAMALVASVSARDAEANIGDEPVEVVTPGTALASSPSRGYRCGVRSEPCPAPQYPPDYVVPVEFCASSPVSC